jgi:hypothetical protein
MRPFCDPPVDEVLTEAIQSVLAAGDRAEARDEGLDRDGKGGGGR